MSTKIYDAYRIKCNTISDLRAFRQELTKLYCEYCYTYFITLCSVKVLSLTERLPYMASINLESADGIIKTIGALVDRRRMSQRKSTSEIPTVDFEEGANNLKENNIIGAATKAALSLIESAEHDKYDDYHSVKASLALFECPGDNEHCLLMAFGSNFTQFLNNLIWKPENSTLAQKQFVDKWEFSDFHYQNQTDQPDDISEEDWDFRRNAWDIVLESGVPREDGVIINMYCADQFDHDLTFMCMYQPAGSKYYDKITTDIVTHITECLSERVERNGFVDACDEFINNHEDFKQAESTDKVRIVSRLNREFRKAYDNNDEEIVALVLKHKLAYSDYILNFTDENIIHNLKTMNVFDFTKIPQYSSFMKSE